MCCRVFCFSEFHLSAYSAQHFTIGFILTEKFNGHSHFLIFFMYYRATKVLTEMRTTFGANSSCLLCVNSSEDGLIKHQENPWVSCVSHLLSLFHFPLLSLSCLSESVLLQKIWLKGLFLPPMTEK